MLDNLETYKLVKVRENERVIVYPERAKLEKPTTLRKLQKFRKIKTLCDALEVRENKT